MKDRRIMWLMVMFDLPVVEQEQRNAASKFRRHLINDGFLMLQYSVYARNCVGQVGVDKHNKRLQLVLPENGSVRTLQITDLQYGRMGFLLGEAGKSEKAAGSQLILL